MLICADFFFFPAFSSTPRARSPKQKMNTSNNNLGGKMKGTENGNEIVN